MSPWSGLTGAQKSKVWKGDLSALPGCSSHRAFWASCLEDVPYYIIPLVQCALSAGEQNAFWASRLEVVASAHCLLAALSAPLSRESAGKSSTDTHAVFSTIYGACRACATSTDKSALVETESRRRGGHDCCHDQSDLSYFDHLMGSGPNHISATTISLCRTVIDHHTCEMFKAWPMGG